jgi:cell division transport system permease protein
MHALREALAAIRRAPLLTGLSAAMVALALFVVGLFVLATFNLREALEAIEERVEVVAYLRDDVRQNEIDLILSELSGLPEVRSARYVSKRDAMERARADLEDFGEIFSDLSVNPLPQSIELELQPGSRDPNVVARVADAAAAYPFVEDARYGREWVDRLFTLRRVGAGATAVLGTAFAAVAALIIGAALRIAIFARRDEIYVMRLVGARNGFIRRPFLVEGALAGLFGGVTAWALTYATYRAVYSTLFAIAWIPTEWILMGLAIAVAFGIVSSALAIRRHLKEI